MKVQDVVRAVIKDRGLTQAEVASRAGLPGQGSISMFLRSKSMRIESLQMILDACGGYEIVVRDKDINGLEYVIGDETTGPSKRINDVENEKALFNEFLNWYRNREETPTPGSGPD